MGPHCHPENALPANTGSSPAGRKPFHQECRPVLEPAPAETAALRLSSHSAVTTTVTSVNSQSTAPKTLLLRKPQTALAPWPRVPARCGQSGPPGHTQTLPETCGAEAKAAMTRSSTITKRQATRAGGWGLGWGPCRQPLARGREYTPGSGHSPGRTPGPQHGQARLPGGVPSGLRFLRGAQAPQVSALSLAWGLFSPTHCRDLRALGSWGLRGPGPPVYGTHAPPM